MNSYGILRDMFDVNLGFDKSEIDIESSEFNKAILIDELVEAFPSRYSYNVSNLINKEYLRSDHVKELLRRMENELLPYETVYGHVTGNIYLTFENVMAFLKDMINLADKYSLLGIFTKDKLVKHLDDELSVQYAIEAIDYYTLEQLGNTILRLM